MLFEIVGALIPTFLVRALVLVATKKWKGRSDRLIYANIASAVICGTIGGFGFADGGPFVWRAFGMYAGVQVIWLIFDMVMNNERQAAEPNRPMQPPNSD